MNEDDARPWDAPTTTTPLADFAKIREATAAHSQSVSSWMEDLAAQMTRRRGTAVQAFLVHHFGSVETARRATTSHFLLYWNHGKKDPDDGGFLTVETVFLVPEKEREAAEHSTFVDLIARYPYTAIEAVAL
jgi:hypothetical protein